ncbi:MAG: glycosyltransferase [Marinilabilia sp.]
MKVLHINQSDSAGGAALAAMRLLDALRAYGTDAGMLVLNAHSRHPAVTGLVRTGKQKMIRNLKFFAEVFSYIPYEKDSSQRFTFSSGRFGYDISRHPLVKDADILHLHWVNQGLLSLKGLDRLIRLGKPVVWTLHDTWPFTGGCHYPGACSGFTATCGQCPLLRSPGEKDLSARQHKLKESIYERTTMSFVGCSEWMRQMAEKSTLVRKDLKHSVQKVFNTVDMDLFAPSSDRDGVKRELGLPQNKKLILFGAANTADPRKGTDLLLRAFRNLHLSHPQLNGQLELMAFGKNIDAYSDKVPFPIHSFHVVSSGEKMAKLYQAADIFVLPSMQDNLPNTVVESLSCGTPVVAFRTGGVPEMVIHEMTGFLAEPGKWRELGAGIRTLLNYGDGFRENARNFALEHFAPEKVASRYQSIYQSLLSGENGKL